VLDSFLSLTRYLVELPAGGQLLKHLFDHILFNPSLWIYSSVDVGVTSPRFWVVLLNSGLTIAAWAVLTLNLIVTLTLGFLIGHCCCSVGITVL